MNSPTYDLLRPEDLLTARFQLYNLVFEGPRLVRVDPSESAGILFYLPPQHFREPLTTALSRPTELVAAEPTMLDFTLTEGVDSLDLDTRGLLGLCEDLGAGSGSSIHVPARVYLKPMDAQWSLGVHASTLNRRSDLWRAKLTGPLRDDRVTALIQIAGVVDGHGVPAWPVLPEGREIFTRYFGGVMAATRFDFSPWGASVRMSGPVGYGDDVHVSEAVALQINTYSHDIDFGRDSRVKVVTHGHLSSGHRATLVELATRGFAVHFMETEPVPETSYARLEILRVIVVDDPVLQVNQFETAYGGPARDMPFRTLRLLTRQTAPLDARAAGGSGPFWVSTSRGGDQLFDLQGVDYSGRVLSFSLPLVFIPGESFDPETFKRTHAEGDHVRVAAVDAQPLAFAEVGESHSGATTLTVESFVFGFRYPQGNPGGDASPSFPPVVPVLTSARVVLDAASQFTGRREVQQVVWNEAYLVAGVDMTGESLGAFLDLTDELELPFDARSVGGLAKPDVRLKVITAVKGLVPEGFELGGVPDVEEMKRQFSGAKILGLVDLIEVLALDDLKSPTLHQKVTTAGVELTYKWTAGIKRDTGQVLRGGETGLSSLVLDAVLTRPLGGSSGISDVTGTLTNIDLDVAGVVVVHFDRLGFHTIQGGPPAITATAPSVQFAGDLAFLQDLNEAFAQTGLSGSSVDVTPVGVTASFAGALPSLSLGMFTIANLAISTQLSIPFDGRPVAFRFAVAERSRPFTVSVSMFGGGGFFALELDTAGIKRVEASLEFGGAMSLDIVVASGGVYVMAGIYFLYADGKVNVSGYLRAGGHLSVLGIVTISVDFFMQLTYEDDTGKIRGEASLTVGIKVLFFSKSVTLHVERSFAGSTGDPTFTDCFELDDWADYCDAFA